MRIIFLTPSTVQCHLNMGYITIVKDVTDSFRMRNGEWFSESGRKPEANPRKRRCDEAGSKHELACGRVCYWEITPGGHCPLVS